MGGKSNSCIPVQVGFFEEGLEVGYNLKCGEKSEALFEADNLECFPTVTVQASLLGAENPCTAFIIFVVENGRKIEKELGRNTEPGSNIPVAVFTVGNVRKIFVRCNGNGTDGCRGEIALVLSYCAVNKCLNDNHNCHHPTEYESSS